MADMIGMDTDIYIYDCHGCGREFQSTKLNECLVCLHKFCNNCFKQGLCVTDYDQLSEEDQDNFHRLLREKKKLHRKLAIQVMIPILCLVIIGLVFSANFLWDAIPKKEVGRWDIFLWIWLFTCFSWFPLIFYEERGKQKIDLSIKSRMMRFLEKYR
jgi:hypothetical protein